MNLLELQTVMRYGTAVMKIISPRKTGPVLIFQTHRKASGRARR